MLIHAFNKNMSSNEMITELIFTIAAARADGENLLRFNYSAEDAERMIKAACKELKVLKRRGAIQLFATAKNFEARDTEAEFLLNKYPSLDGLSENIFIFVKL